MSEDTTYRADVWPVSEVDKLRRENTKLRSENAAANKRIEELTDKNLKLLNENNDLWDKVNNPKMKV